MLKRDILFPPGIAMTMTFKGSLITLTALPQSAAHSKDSGMSTGHTGASNSVQLPPISETGSSQPITKSAAQPEMSEDSAYGSQQSLKSRKL